MKDPLAVCHFGIALLGGLLAACGSNGVITVDPQDSKVYAAYFDQRALPRSETLYVAKSTLVFDALGTGEPDPEHSQMFVLLKREGDPTELAASLSQASKHQRLAQALRLPAPTHVLSAAELTEIFSANPPEIPGVRQLRVDRNWNEFYRRYPLAKGYEAFSPIGYSSNGSEALFYHEHSCGSLCGDGTVVWVTRDSNGNWKVRKTINLWMS